MESHWGKNNKQGGNYNPNLHISVNHECKHTISCVCVLSLSIVPGTTFFYNWVPYHCGFIFIFNDWITPPPPERYNEHY